MSVRFILGWNRLPGVHDVARVERVLDRLHEIDRLAVLSHERAELVDADAMLAGARAPHGDRAQADALGERLRLFALGGIVRVEQHAQVKVAVTDVPDDWRGQPERGRVR